MLIRQLTKLDHFLYEYRANTDLANISIWGKNIVKLWFPPLWNTLLEYQDI